MYLNITNKHEFTITFKPLFNKVFLTPEELVNGTSENISVRLSQAVNIAQGLSMTSKSSYELERLADLMLYALVTLKKGI